MEEETLKRAAEGDSQAILEVERWAGSQDSRELRRLKEIFERAEKKRTEEEAEFWSDLLDVTNTVNSRPHASAEAIDTMWARAQTLGSCEAVQVLGLRSSRLRLLGDLGEAVRILTIAWDLANRCRQREGPGLSPCVSYLNRRQAKLDLWFGRLEIGLKRIETSLAGYRHLSEQGHDVNGDGEGMSLFARGEIRFELKDYTGSLADFGACLDRFPATGAIWPRAYQNLAVVLSRTGKEGREQAYRMLDGHRYTFRPRSDTVEWATFWWVDSQLAIATRRRKDRAIRKLLEVLECFHGLGMRYHYSGVVHDVARIHYPNTDEMKNFLKRVAPAANRLVRDRQVGSLFGEVCDLVKVWPTPAGLMRLDDLLSRLRRVLEERATLPPCLLTDATTA